MFKYNGEDVTVENETISELNMKLHWVKFVIDFGRRIHIGIDEDLWSQKGVRGYVDNGYESFLWLSDGTFLAYCRHREKFTTKAEKKHPVTTGQDTICCQRGNTTCQWS